MVVESVVALLCVESTCVPVIVRTRVWAYAGQSTTWYCSLGSYQFYFRLFFFLVREHERQTYTYRDTDRQTDWWTQTQGGSLNWNWPVNLENQLSRSSALRLQGCSNAFSFLFYEFWMMGLRSSLSTKLLPPLLKPKSTNSFRSTINNFIWPLNYTQAENPHTNQERWMVNSEQMSHSYPGHRRGNLFLGSKVP